MNIQADKTKIQKPRIVKTSKRLRLGLKSSIDNFDVTSQPPFRSAV